MLKDLYSDDRVKKIKVMEDKLIVENIWDEEFDITFFDIAGHGIAAHATLQCFEIDYLFK